VLILFFDGWHRSIAASIATRLDTVWTESARCSTMSDLSCGVPENDLMSLADRVSRPVPVLAKLAIALRSIPAVQFVIAKWAALLGNDKKPREKLARALIDDAPGVAEDIVEPVAIAMPNGGLAGEADKKLERPVVEDVPEDIVALPLVVAPPKLPAAIVLAEPAPDGMSERERLIRRRWAETGSKMWNPDFNGAGRAALNIQGQVELLPAKRGERLPRYDILVFRLVGDDIVCEGVVLDPPKRRFAPPRAAQAPKGA
jgi:hypothetical protein